MSCVYFLRQGSKVVYIGQTTNLNSRLKRHGDKVYDNVRHIECDRSKLSFYEKRLIRYFRPKLNKQLMNKRLISFRMDTDLLVHPHKLTEVKLSGFTAYIEKLAAKDSKFIKK